MPAVKRAGRIERIVALERIEAEEQRPVERGLQCRQRLPERRLGRAVRVLVEPQDAIAANVAALDPRRAAADARRMKFAGGVAPARLGAKRGDRLLRQERGVDRPAVLLRSLRKYLGGSDAASRGYRRKTLIL